MGIHILRSQDHFNNDRHSEESMIRNLLLFITLIFTQICWSHPGIGLVYDGDHTIYYTDLSHIWQMDTRTGEKKIAIENIHSHELYLDKEGNLYGEHYWYDDADDVFRNYIWKMEPGGNTSKVRDVQPGENTDFSFVRDPEFRSYAFRQDEEFSSIVLSDSTGSQVINRGRYSNLGWSYLSSESVLYFTDYPSVYALEDNSLRTVAEDLSDARIPFSIQSDTHHLYGIWTDKDENVYVAVYGGRIIKKINAEGTIEPVLKSDFFWSPVNGIFDKDKHLWLMESSLNGRIRVRKINSSEWQEGVSFLGENLVLIGVPLLLIVMLIYRKQRFKSKYSRKNV